MQNIAIADQIAVRRFVCTGSVGIKECAVNSYYGFALGYTAQILDFPALLPARTTSSSTFGWRSETVTTCALKEREPTLKVFLVDVTGLVWLDMNVPDRTGSVCATFLSVIFRVDLLWPQDSFKPRC